VEEPGLNIQAQPSGLVLFALSSGLAALDAVQPVRIMFFRAKIVRETLTSSTGTLTPAYHKTFKLFASRSLL